jgi:hypothetical protein
VWLIKTRRSPQGHHFSPAAAELVPEYIPERRPAPIAASGVEMLSEHVAIIANCDKTDLLALVCVSPLDGPRGRSANVARLVAIDMLRQSACTT